MDEWTGVLHAVDHCRIGGYWTSCTLLQTRSKQSSKPVPQEVAIVGKEKKAEPTHSL